MHFYRIGIAVMAVILSACGSGFRAANLSSQLASGGARAPISGQPLGSVAPEKLSCDVASQGTSEKSMRRLTKQELVNTLGSLFGADLVATADVKLALEKIPDQNASSNAEFDNRIVDVEGLLDVAQLLVDKTFADAVRATRVFGCSGADFDQCRILIADKFAFRALRGNVPAELKSSVASLMSAVGGQDGLKLGAIRVLLSPYFHQHVELAAEAGTDPKRLRLTPYEVASRLAYRLTGTMPDEQLLQAAASSQLGTLTQVEAQAARLMQTPEARAHWRRFLADWLQAKSGVDPSELIAQEAGITAQGFGAEARAELLRFGEYIIFDKKGSLADLLTDNTVFAPTDRLASVFGVAKSDMPQKSDRGFAGIILRPAKMISASVYTSPILRGVYVRKRVLCEELPSPPQDIVSSRLSEVELMPHAEYSNRDINHRVTSGSACVSCHSLINPVGFALENFGPLGTPRAVERVYEAAGATGVTHQLKTYVDDLRLSSVATPAKDAGDLVSELVESPKSKTCFSQRLIEGTQYRHKSGLDNCVLNETNDLLHSGRPLLESIAKSVANDGIFWKALEGVER